MPLYDKEKTLKFLDENNIKYEKIEHEAAFTMEELDKLGITSKGLVVKNLFLRDAKGKIHYLISAPEERKIEMNMLAGKIGSTRLSFASEYNEADSPESVQAADSDSGGSDSGNAET